MSDLRIIINDYPQPFDWTDYHAKRWERIRSQGGTTAAMHAVQSAAESFGAMAESDATLAILHAADSVRFSKEAVMWKQPGLTPADARAELDRIWPPVPEVTETDNE